MSHSILFNKTTLQTKV